MADVLFELVGGPQDGAKVRTRDGISIPSHLYVSPECEVTETSAWTTMHSKRFNARYEYDGRVYRFVGYYEGRG